MEGYVLKTGKDVSVLSSYSLKHHGGKAALEQTQGFRVIYAHHPQKFLLFQFLKCTHIVCLALLGSVQKCVIYCQLQTTTVRMLLNDHMSPKKTLVQVVYDLILPPLLMSTSALLHQ